MAKVTDSTLAKFIRATPSKRASEVAADLEALRRNAGTRALAGILDQLASLVASGVQQPSTLPALMRLSVALREENMRTSSTELWKHAFPALSTVAPEVWMIQVPTPQAVEWTRKQFKLPVPGFVAQTKTLGVQVYETPIADWLLQRAGPTEIAPLLEAALDLRTRARGLDDARAILAGFLKRDAKGSRLLQVVKQARGSEERLKVVAETAAVQVSAHAGKLAREVPEVTASLVRRMFGSVSENNKLLGKQATDLAQFTVNVLKAQPLPAESQACLDALARAAAGMRVEMLSRKVPSAIWTYEPIDAQTSTGAMISLEGARQWALVYARAQVDGRDLGYLESYASNVGLEEFATSGQDTNFNPSFHDDTEGGLLSGDQVTVTSSGWRFNGVPVVKAKVRAKADDK